VITENVRAKTASDARNLSDKRRCVPPCTQPAVDGRLSIDERLSRAPRRRGLVVGPLDHGQRGGWG
jgi:hypothetical protein